MLVAGVTVFAALGGAAAVAAGGRTGTRFVAGCSDPSTPPVAPGSGAASVQGGPEPDGSILHTDPAGFRVALPEGYSRSTDAGVVCFVDGRGERRLTVGPGSAMREFAFTGRDGRRWRVRTQPSSAGGFALTWTAPDPDWSSAASQFATIAATFTSL